MLLSLALSILLTLPPVTSALPTIHFLSSRSAPSAVSVLLQIAPSSTSCANASYPSECATASQAAPYLISTMATHNVTTAPELAALLSLIAYESGEFQYNINHFPAPGNPGQGTRNMQMAPYNLLYARSIPALAAPLANITTASSTDGLTDDQLDAIRALVLPDDYTWGSAAWFLASQCASIRPALQAGGQDGWEAYLGCVGTAATSDRLAYWTRANQALGIS
jgi:hypothetical protein